MTESSQLATAKRACKVIVLHDIEVTGGPSASSDVAWTAIREELIASGAGWITSRHLCGVLRNSAAPSEVIRLMLEAADSLPPKTLILIHEGSALGLANFRTEYAPPRRSSRPVPPRPEELLALAEAEVDDASPIPAIHRLTVAPDGYSWVAVFIRSTTTFGSPEHLAQAHLLHAGAEHGHATRAHSPTLFVYVYSFRTRRHGEAFARLALDTVARAAESFA